MYDSKTVGIDTQDSEAFEPRDMLYLKQKEDIASMRSSLLSCSGNDAQSAQNALRNITVMRVYHQISRIIRYTEMMDKIEDKLYTSIERSLENMNENSPSTWIQLLTIQEKLQKSMIESHKLLQPYLDPELFNTVTVVQKPAEAEDYIDVLIDQDSREKIRTSAQTVLAAITGLDNKDGESNE